MTPHEMYYLDSSHTAIWHHISYSRLSLCSYMALHELYYFPYAVIWHHISYSRLSLCSYMRCTTFPMLLYGTTLVVLSPYATLIVLICGITLVVLDFPYAVIMVLHRTVLGKYGLSMQIPNYLTIHYVYF